MTTPRYPTTACAMEFQDRGEATPSEYAWIVNFNNGNSNLNNRNNNNRVRAVRGPAREFRGEKQAQVELRDLQTAWKRARRNKVPSRNQLDFDARWADRLIDLQQALNAGTWRPRPTTCFVATRPKAREIHAPDFGDRVVHHWLVPQLEAIYEPGFIHDSFANRKGKGSHAAVRRLQSFVRQLQDGQGGGFFLQMDVHNFFNAIHRPTLYAMLKCRMERAGLPWIARKATHALLQRSPVDIGVRYRCTPEERALVPTHKRLDHAAPGCGLPIGNLSSQFFANVYLDALDQFVKHGLKARRYLRYVDDFVLVHHDRDQLAAWQEQITVFLRDTLRLSLKPDIKLRRLADGIDFLGYVMHPTHTLCRRRVVAHATEKLAAFEAIHIRRGQIRASREQLDRIRSVLASYQGHFQHANTYRLQLRQQARFPWVKELHRGQGSRKNAKRARNHRHD